MLAECNRKKKREEIAFIVPSGLNEKGDGLGEREEKGRRIYAERKLAEGFHADEVNPTAASVMCWCSQQGDGVLPVPYPSSYTLSRNSVTENNGNKHSGFFGTSL
jgi:hypothetical protein